MSSLVSSLVSSPVSLVLGGGGARAIAHIGAWRGLQERAIAVRRIFGSSAGALVGACIASGMSWPELVRRARRLAGAGVFSIDARVLVRGGQSPGLLREKPLRDLIRALLPVRSFLELAVPLSVNAVDLASGEVVWFGESGHADPPLADALYASCALPFLYPPAAIAGRSLVDGGIVDPLPIARAHACGGGRIVAVDLAATAHPAGGQLGMVDTYRRALEIVRGDRAAGTPDVPLGEVVRITPTLSGRHTFDLSRADDLVEAGYRASLSRLAGDDVPRVVPDVPEPEHRGGLRWVPRIPWLVRSGVRPRADRPNPGDPRGPRRDRDAPAA